MTLPDEEWLFIREVVDLVGPRFEHEGQAENALLRRLTAGTLLAWETGSIRYWQERDWAETIEIDLGEGPIPKEFWEHFLQARGSWRDRGNQAESEEIWETGDFSFTLISELCTYRGYAHGVLVHRSGIADILGERRQPRRRGEGGQSAQPVPVLSDGGPVTAPEASRRGRVPTYDWIGAIAHVAAIAHSRDGLFTESGGEPNASHIARLMEAWFTGKLDRAPADSELRKYAGRVLAEINALKLLPADNQSRAD